MRSQRSRLTSAALAAILCAATQARAGGAETPHAPVPAPAAVQAQPTDADAPSPTAPPEADLKEAPRVAADGRPAPRDGAPHGWQTWTWDGNCFAIHYAKGPSLSGVQNGDTYIAVKHLPRERNYDNVSVVSGFGDITGTQGTLEVGGQEFPLLVYGGAGFVRSGDPEQRLMSLLAKSSEATVTWYKKDGLAVQSYDVSNFAPAKHTIDVACPHVTPPSTVASSDDKPAEKAEKPADAAPAAKRRKRR